MTEMREIESEIRTKKNKLEDKLIGFFTKLIDELVPKKIPSTYVPAIELILKYLKS